MSELHTDLQSGNWSGKDLNLPGWAKNLRKNAAEQFRMHGFPKRTDETWKYTVSSLQDLQDIRLDRGTDTGYPGQSLAHDLPGSGYRVNLLNGRMVGVKGTLPSGVKLLDMKDALESETDGLQSVLETLSGLQGSRTSSHGFSALNTATLGAGLYIHVPPGVDAGRMHLNWAVSQEETTRLINSRICLLIEAGASLEIVERFGNLQNSTHTTNVVVQAELQNGATLNHVRLQAEPDSACLITRTEISQLSNSDYSYFGFDLGGRVIRHDLHSSLLGPGAKANLNGAYLLDGNRHVDNHARVDHIAPDGQSDQYFRGVASGSSKAVFNTAVCVHPGADGSQASQSNANILLSKRAEIDTKPELEIYADEVIASHGATVGQLDEQAVFYLRSRGLNEQQAREILTTAFCKSVSDRLGDPELATVISQRMMDVMPQAD